MKYKYLLIVLVPFIYLNAVAQSPTFELIKPAGSAMQKADIPYALNREVFESFIDYDGDGDLDILFDNDYDNSFIIYENDGVGNFMDKGKASFSDYLGTSLTTQAYVFEDFNGDKIQDLLSCNGGTDKITKLYLGDGSGNFVESSTQLVGGQSSNIIAVDIDSDGDMDVFMKSRVNYTLNKTILYINDGTGNFSETPISLESTGWSAIAVSSPFDGNKRNMVVISSSFTDGLGSKRLYQYDGAGNYRLVSDNCFDEIPLIYADIHFGDITNDGKEDVLFEMHMKGLYFYSNETDTTYTYISASNLDKLGGSETEYEIAFDDFNNDGNYDLIYTNQKNGSNIYHSDGTGNFNLIESFQNMEIASSYGHGDLTGDGYPEFLEKGSMDGGARIQQLYTNNTDGTFTLLKNNITKEVGYGSVHIAKFDADDDNDLIILGTPHDSNTESDIYLNDGTGVLTNYGALHIDNTDPSILEDFNRDGITDMLVGNKKYLNDGNADFTQTGSFPVSMNIEHILKFNANKDYAEDVLFYGGGKVQLFRNNGAGSYAAIENTGLVGFSDVAADAGDLDGDGDLDLVVSGKLNSGESATKIYFNNGDAFFSETLIELTNIYGGDVKIADLNKDNYPDILLAGDGYQLVYLNNVDDTSFTLHQSLEGITNATLEVIDIDFDGDMDFLSTGVQSLSPKLAVTKLYINNGTGTFTDSGINFKGVQSASISFGDIDGDYDMDLFLSGNEPDKGVTKAYVARAYKNTSTRNVIDIKETVCDSYYFIDELLTTTGNYSKTIITSEGENRTINLELTIGNEHNTAIAINANGYYEFNGTLLKESGTYETTFISSTGCDSIVSLDLTLTDFVAAEDCQFITYELIQPDTCPQLKSDFFPSTYGESQILDLDGDGDNDYLSIGNILNGNSQFMGYINQGNGNFTWVDYNISLNDNTPKPTILHGDLNGDGIEDLVVSGERYIDGTESDYGTQIYFGDLDKGFVLQDTIHVPTSFYGFIGMADLTGNTHNDLLVGHYNNGIYLYKNDGTGNFKDSLISEMNFSWDVAISEPYNGGKRDVLIGCYSGGYKSKLYRFEGTEFKDTGISFESTYGKRSYFADANNDGAPDALVSASSSIDLYLNDGVGMYHKSSEDFDGNRSGNNQFKFIDLNNDNAAEVIIDKPNYPNNDKLLVYWNDGSGNFTTTDTYELNLNYSFGYIITTGDLNGDDYIDIFFNGDDKNNQRRFGGLINNQSNGFDELKYNIASDISNGDVKFEDFDGDNDPDMIVMGDNAMMGPVTELYTNDGTGKFSSIETHHIDSLKYSSVAFADVDGNLSKDLVIMGMNRNDSVITNFYRNSGGIFTCDSNVVLNALAKGSATFIKANDDDYQDLITIGEDSLGIPLSFLYLNDGAGNFSTVESGISGLENSSISTGDVNKDGRDDILLVGSDTYGYNKTNLYLSNGDGTFSLDYSNALITASDAHIVDVNGDHINDIYLAGTGVQYIYTNDGNGHFSLHQELDKVWKSKAQFDDIDLDGDMDFIVSGDWEIFNGSTRACLYINDGNGNFTQKAGNLLHSVYNGSFHVMDIDGDYDKDMVLSGNVNSKTGSTRTYLNNTCSPNDAQLHANSCNSYDFYGQILTETGVYYHDIITNQGCDRTLALNFTFDGYRDEAMVTSCHSYEWNGETYTVSGVYQKNYITSAGCDSIAILDLTIDLCTDVETNENNHARIYPNPAFDYLNIEIPDERYTSIAIVDMMGRTILTEPMGEKTRRIDISNLSRGTYILKALGQGIPSKEIMFIKD